MSIKDIHARSAELEQQHDADYAAFKDFHEETQILWRIKFHIDAALKTMYPKWKKEKYLVAVYHSGTEDLYRSPLDLLAYNKKRCAKLAVMWEKKRVQTQMQL